MPVASPVRDRLFPRVAALVDQAVAEGTAREVAVAVLIDIITSPAFDTAAPSPTDDSAPGRDYERGNSNVVLIAGGSAANVPTVGVILEDDFLADPTTRF
jgi:hypothetical protein